MAVLIGTSSAGTDTANSNLSQTAFGVRLQCTASGTVTTLNLKSTDNSSMASRHGALYADNAGQLTGATRLSADITTPVLVAGWNVYTVSPGIAVVSGTFYWLQFLANGFTYNYTDNAASGGTTRDTTGQATLTNPAATTTSSFTTRFNAYADGTLDSTAVQPTYGPRRTTQLQGPFNFVENRRNPAVAAAPAVITVKRLPATGVG